MLIEGEDMVEHDMPRRIVIGPECDRPERLGAQELREHLGLLGIDAQVVETDQATNGDGASICLGAALLPPDATEALGCVRDDGFLLYRRDATIHIAGRMPRGTLFGCYGYLESLGLRWPAPGQPAELTTRGFALPDDPMAGVDNPDFPIRGNDCYCPTNARDFKNTIEIVEWMARQRYNLHSFLRQDSPVLTDFDENWYRLAGFVHERGLEFALGSHLSWPGLLTYEDKMLFEKHPEYFPLRGGERRPSGPANPSLPAGTYGPDAVGTKTGSGMSVCVSNPKVIELITKHLRCFLDEHDEIDVMGLWPPDTKWEGCECADCRKLVEPERMWSMVANHERQWRATSDQTIHLVGQVAAGIRETHPNIRILTWGWCTSEPGPQNVTPAAPIQFDEFYTPCFTHAIDSQNCLHHHIHPQAWRDWAAVENVELGWIHTGAAWALTAAEFPHAWLIKKNIEFLRQLGGKAVTYNLEVGGNEDGSVRGDTTGHYLFEACGINYYVFGRVGWNADLELRELYADFAETRFGSAAAGAMAEYYCQVIEKYESWQHSQPLPDFRDVWGSSEVRCRAPWEVAVDIFDPDMIQRARELLDEADRLSEAECHKERVQSERNIFEYTVRMREVFKIHQARQKLDEAGLTEASERLAQAQREILAAARSIDLPKRGGEINFDGEKSWIELMWM